MPAARIASLVALAVVFGSGCARRQQASLETNPSATPLVAVASPVASAWAAKPVVARPPLVYVTDEAGGSVAVVDPAKAALVANIVVGKRPRGMALSRDQQQLFVAVSGSPIAAPGSAAPKPPPADRSADGVAVVDLTARKVVRVLPGGQDPESLALAPDGDTLYVSNGESAELTSLAISSGAVRGKASVGKEPGGVAVTPDGKLVYVACKQDNAVSAVDTTTLATVSRLPTGKGPRSILLAADGVTAYVTNELGRTVTVFDTGAKSSTEIPIHEDSPMPSGVRPMGLALSPDGKWLYVSTGRGGSLAIVDTTLKKQVRSIDGIGDRPWGIGLNGDGTLLYSANGTSTDFSIVNLATGNVDKRVHTGGLPWGVVVAR